MDWQKLLSHLYRGENSTVKFLGKVESADDIAPVMIAMANSLGGKIFAGIDSKNLHLSGTSFDAAKINDILKNSVRPAIKVAVEVMEKNGKTILSVTIPEGKSKPYFYNEKCYVMENKWARRASESEEKEMQKNHTHSRQDAEETPKNYSADPFDDDLLAITSELIALTDSSDDTESELAQTALPMNTSRELNLRQIKALQHVKESKSIQNKKYRELFSISHKTAHLELIDLVSRGFLKQQGSGRSTAYVLDRTPNL